jgi:hypothetical protein
MVQGVYRERLLKALHSLEPQGSFSYGRAYWG